MNTKWSMKVTGMDGTIELLTDRIVFLREGILSKLAGSAKRELPYSSVAEILFKDANTLGFGSIDFIRIGGNAEKDKNLYKVKFRKDKQQDFVQLKEKVFEILNYYSRQNRN